MSARRTAGLSLMGFRSKVRSAVCRLDLAKYINRDFLHGYALNTALSSTGSELQHRRIFSANHLTYLLQIDPNVFAIMARKLNELHCIAPLIAS